MQLRKEKAALETQLGARKTENEALGKELAKLKTDANNTERALKEKLVSGRTLCLSCTEKQIILFR